jgi:O-antigen/teichoic acid export membrane protein
MLDKLKSLSKQTLIYGTSTIVGRFLNFILVPFYTNVFPPAEYGIVAIVFAYIAFFNIIYSLGFEAGYFRFAASNEIGNEKQNFSHPFFVIMLNSGFLSLLILAFSKQLSPIVGVPNTDFIVYAAIILFLDALALVPFAYLRLKNKATVFVTIKLINICVNVAMNLILVLGFKMGLIAVFISNLIASLVTILILLPIILRNISFEYNKELMSELRRFSLPYLPAALASMAIQVINIPITKYLTDDHQVGIYNANYRLGIFMMLVVSMFEYAWRPFFLQNAKEPESKQLFAKVMTIFVGAASLMFVILTFFIQDIIKIPLPFKGHLIGAKYWNGVYIVPLILLGYLFLGIYTNLIAGIYIEKKTKYLPAITGSGAAANIIAGFVLIPIIGIMGGAWAVLVSYIVMTIGIYIVNRKYYPVPYEKFRLTVLLLCDAVALGLFYAMWNGLLPSELFIRIIAAAILISFIFYFSGLWKAKKLFQ